MDSVDLKLSAVIYEGLNDRFDNTCASYVEEAKELLKVLESKKPTESERTVLDFVYNRLINVHGENKNCDYMLTLKKYLDKI